MPYLVPQDMGSPSLSSTAVLEVSVLDADDRDPEFNSPLYKAHLQEDPGYPAVSKGTFRRNQDTQQ